jgi:hypothetical protein
LSTGFITEFEHFLWFLQHAVEPRLYGASLKERRTQFEHCPFTPWRHECGEQARGWMDLQLLLCRIVLEHPIGGCQYVAFHGALLHVFDLCRHGLVVYPHVA